MSLSESVLGRATVTVRRPVWRQILIVFGEMHCRLLHNSLSRRGRARSGTNVDGRPSSNPKPRRCSLDSHFRGLTVSRYP